MPDSIPTPAPSPSGWLRPALGILLGALAIGYILVLAGHMSASAGGADSSGYLNSARLLNRGNFLAAARTVTGFAATEFGDMAFQPLGFRLQPTGGLMAPTYPIGLPLHLLVAARVAGWHNATLTINLLTVLASGGLMWALARRLNLAPVWAVVGVLLLWLCPLYFFSALQPMSDLLALGWSMAVLYCALRSREHWGWGLLCGIALGCAVLVRPTNALLVVPVLVALGWQWRRLLVVGLGGLPGALIFAFYNWRVYGSPVVTGYGDVSSAFSRDFLGPNLAHFAHWIPTLLSPLILVSLAAPFLPAVRQSGYAVLAVWWVTITGFYAFYFHSGETWWYLRFILPGFPVLILAMLVVLATAVRSLRFRPVPAAAVGVLMVVFAAGWQIRQIQRLGILPYARAEQSYPDAASWAKKNLPPNSAICCMQVSGAFFYYSDFLLIRWDAITREQATALLTAVDGQQRPVYAALFPFETAQALETMGGHWTKLTTIGQVTFWQRQP